MVYMKILRSVLLPFALLVLISSTQGCGNAECVLTGFVNCGNDGGADKSIINGTVVDVIGGPGVSGIKVIAERNGERVASDTTNSEGEFKLKVREGDITLLFEILDAVTVGRVFTITEDSEVFLDVSLDLVQKQIEVEDWNVSQDPIRCGSNQSFIIAEEDLIDFTVNGNGKDCIRAKGDCLLIGITVQNIALNDCNEGILAEGSADVNLEALAVPTLTIDAESNGIHTKGNSSVTLIGGNIIVTSTQRDGIRAEDSSDVEIQPSGLCTIEGFDDAIDPDPTATIDPDDCTLVQP